MRSAHSVLFAGLWFGAFLFMGCTETPGDVNVACEDRVGLARADCYASEAVGRSDEIFCGKIRADVTATDEEVRGTIDKRNRCYADLARSTGRESLCDSLSQTSGSSMVAGETEADKCRVAVFQYHSYYHSCSVFPDQAEYVCHREVGRTAYQTRCGLLDDGERRYRCVVSKAIYAGNPDFCEELYHEGRETDCKAEVRAELLRLGVPEGVRPFP